MTIEFYSKENLQNIFNQLLRTKEQLSNPSELATCEALVQFINFALQFDTVFHQILSSPDKASSVTINCPLKYKTLVINYILKYKKIDPQVLKAKVQVEILSLFATSHLIPLMQQSLPLLLCIEPGKLQNTLAKWLNDPDHCSETKSAITQYITTNKALNDALSLVPNAAEDYKAAILGRKETRAHVLIPGLVQNNPTKMLDFLLGNPAFLSVLIPNFFVIRNTSKLFEAQAGSLVAETRLKHEALQLVISDRKKPAFESATTFAGSWVSNKTSQFNRFIHRNKTASSYSMPKLHESIRFWAVERSLTVENVKEAKLYAQTEVASERKTHLKLFSETADGDLRLTEPAKGIFAKISEHKKSKRSTYHTPKKFQSK